MLLHNAFGIAVPVRLAEVQYSKCAVFVCAVEQPVRDLGPACGQVRDGQRWSAGG